MRRAILAVLLVAASCSREVPPPRNLLLITLDTLRADHLGAYGYDRPTSPHLDAFAARSTLFEDALCNVPTTLPSHVSFFTGLPPALHGARRNGVEPDRDLVTLFDLLEARGLRTAAVVASGVLGPRFSEPLGPGEVLLPRTKGQFQIPAERVNAEALRWLDAHAGERFALWLHYYDTHEPYDPPQPFREAFARPYDGLLPQALDVDTLVALNDDPAVVLTAEDRRHIIDLYDAEVAYLDAQLGALFTALEERGLLESTAAVLVGDHGQALGEQDFWGHGLRLLQPVVRIPYMIRLPGQDEGRRVVAPVDSLDLLPTLVELFRLEAVEDLAGRSLVPALAGRPVASRSLRVVERRRFDEAPEAVAVALYGPGWKLVYDQEPDRPPVTTFSRDPAALDLDSGHRPDAAQRGLLDEALALVRSGAPPSGALDAETRELLEALGYL
jgi:arylsulfatase A-like enzyme